MTKTKDIVEVFQKHHGIDRGSFILGIPNILNFFQSVHPFVRLLVRGIKYGHLIGRHNDVTANMAALAVCMCLAASALDTPRSSVWVSQARRALAQKFTVIVWCEGSALAIGTWVYLFCYLGT